MSTTVTGPKGLEGITAAVVTVEATQARPVHKREITHARELQPA